jgi:hypothetical protein
MQLSRRRWLELAALGLAGGTLSSRTGQAASSSVGRPRNLVVMYAYGGWDPAVGLDPKVGLPTVSAPPGEHAFVGGLDFFLSDSSPSMRTYFERHGAVSAILRGLDMRSLSHEICFRYALGGSSNVETPDVAAITGHVLSPERPLPYLVLGDRALTGPLAGSTGRVGLNNQLGNLLDRERAYPPLDTVPPLDATDSDLVQSWLEGRVSRQRAARVRPGTPAEIKYDDFLKALDRGNLLYEHAAAFSGEATLDSQIDLAVYALSSQMSRAALVDSRMNWDSHIEIQQQLSFYETFFASLDRLVSQLAETPGEAVGSKLIDETLVIALSEMGRTPLLNDIGGKDHWPYTSALVAGGPVRGDRVFGATDDELVGHPVDLQTGELDPNGAILTPAQLISGLLCAVGVDPEPWFPGTTPYTGPFSL